MSETILVVSEHRRLYSPGEIPAVDGTWCVVDLPVRLVPPKVLPGVLQGRQRQDDTDGDQSYLWLKGVHHGDKVQNGQTHKVDVSQTVKLLEKVHGNEKQKWVFGGFDGVGWEEAIGLRSSPQSLVGQIGRQAAEFSLPCPLTLKGIPHQSQRAPPSHGCTVSGGLDPPFLLPGFHPRKTWRTSSLSCHLQLWFSASVWGLCWNKWQAAHLF